MKGGSGGRGGGREEEGGRRGGGRGRKGTWRHRGHGDSPCCPRWRPSWAASGSAPGSRGSRWQTPWSVKVRDALSFRRARRFCACVLCLRSRATHAPTRPGTRGEAGRRQGGHSRDLAEEQLEDGVALRLGHAHDPAGEACVTDVSIRLFICGEGALGVGRRAEALLTGVDVDALPARNGVHAHDGVHGLDGLAPNGLAGRPRTVRLRNRAVHGLQALEVLLEAGAEGRVEGVAIAGASAHVCFPGFSNETEAQALTRSSRGCRRRREGR